MKKSEYCTGQIEDENNQRAKFHNSNVNAILFALQTKIPAESEIRWNDPDTRPQPAQGDLYGGATMGHPPHSFKRIGDDTVAIIGYQRQTTD